MTAYRRSVQAHHPRSWTCAFLIVLAFTSGASGHATLMKAVPADGSVVREAPSTLTLSFNEPVAPLVIRLMAPDGAPIALAPAVAENATISVAPPPLARGTHVLSWRVISADGHPVGGSVVFSVGAPSRPSWSETRPSTDAGVTALLWTARLLIYVGFFLGIGGAVFTAWISRERQVSAEAIRPVLLLALSAGLLAASASIGLQGMDALDLPLSAWREPPVWRTGLETSYGDTAVVAICAACAGGLSVLVISKRATRMLSAAALLGAALALSFSGHAATAKPEALSRTALFLHVACAVFWVGALLPLFVGAGRAPAGRPELDRFSRLIPIPFAIVLATGSCLALLQISRIDALWRTSYGQILLAKLALVACLLALAWLNRYRLVPALDRERVGVSELRRSLAAELGLGLAILAVVALWRFTPPPRALALAAPISIHLHGERAMAEVEIAREPTRTGTTAANVLVLDADFQPLAAKEVAVVLANPASGIEPIRRQALRAGENSWRIEDVRIPVAGRWDLRVEVLVNDFEKVILEETVPLPRIP